MRSILTLLLICLSCLSLTSCTSLRCWFKGERLTRVPLDDFTISQTEEITVLMTEFGVYLDKEEGIWIESSYAQREPPGPDGRFFVWLDVSTQRIYDLQQARYMAVRLIDELLDRLNNRPALAQYFTPDDLYVSIELESFFGRFVDPLYVGRMELKDGELTVFYAHTALDPDTPVYHKHTEPFTTSRIIAATEKRVLKEKYSSQYSALEALVEPIDWQSGNPIYKKAPTQYDEKGTRSNIPKQSTGIIWREEDFESTRAYQQRIGNTTTNSNIPNSPTNKGSPSSATPSTPAPAGS